MKLVSITFVRNEADILETFVRYHAQIFDRMIVVNHHSVDGSMEILERLKAEGLPLDLDNESRIDFQLGEFMTNRMSAAIRTLGADWVMPIDADEFLTTRDGRAVREAVKHHGPARVVKVPWRTYVPLPTADFGERNVLERLKHRRAEGGDEFCKVLVPRGLALTPDSAVGAGSHTFERSGALAPTELPFTRSEHLVLAHFPLRSVEQLMTKVLVGWLVILAKPNREYSESFHLKILYDRLLKGEIMTPDELTRMAMNYSRTTPVEFRTEDLVHTPVRPERGDVGPRYDPTPAGNPLNILMRVAEEHAAAIAEARRELERHAPGFSTTSRYVKRGRLLRLFRLRDALRNRIGELLR